VTARRAKRENGGLGEDPPGSTMMTYLQVLRTWTCWHPREEVGRGVIMVSTALLLFGYISTASDQLL
jgi:hypothetical protein